MDKEKVEYFTPIVAQLTEIAILNEIILKIESLDGKARKRIVCYLEDYFLLK